MTTVGNNVILEEVVVTGATSTAASTFNGKVVMAGSDTSFLSILGNISF
jgi:hypothetical protein